MSKAKGLESLTTTPKIPMKARGCSVEAWGGAIGIDSTGRCIYDHNIDEGGSAICDKGDYPLKSRQALARHMIRLWQEFGDLP